MNYDPTSNLLIPAEMARILGGLYSAALLEPWNTAQLLAYMQDTNYEALIPAAVPADITVFHKYGLLDQELHDAVILAKGGHAYALVICTEGDDISSVSERTENHPPANPSRDRHFVLTAHMLIKAESSGIMNVRRSEHPGTLVLRLLRGPD